ncbi:MAG TPA: phosphate ABC transporter substrate-binding protein PstS [Bryobacteraceae bacterium]|jgi:phosphate transport system substrate-binding protein
MKKILLAGALLPLIGAMTANAASTINASGASFPAPIYQKWFEEYKAKTGIQVNYQGIGSGAGIKALTEGTVDFAASDAPMTDQQIAGVKVKPLHFPTVLGAVVLTYNIPGVPAKLKFSGPTVAGIFMGAITKWNDPKIKADNPGVNLPAKDNDILVVHRADSSGTSFIFTDYLSKVSPEWKSKVGAATSVQWPVGLSGAQNAGVAGLVRQTPGSIGYVELIYAVQQKMGYADIKNANGKWITPSFEGVTAAAAGMKDMPADFRVSITNGPGDKTYPISSFTWMLIPSQISDPAKKKAITDFLTWMITDGQKECEAMSYAPLPPSVVAKEKKQIAEIK